MLHYGAVGCGNVLNLWQSVTEGTEVIQVQYLCIVMIHRNGFILQISAAFNHWKLFFVETM